jgi:energy-coupling factor transporter ATP-binding protein EcfA2
MANRPQRLILINAGRYEYANVELGGSLQIVGPNNTGKTTLINTLQFLYLDDSRKMEFGSYSSEQTRDYYFPNQYSYVMFEVLGPRGKCVLGWRGQSRVGGGEPTRFLFDGPFEPGDFIDPNHNVREPKDVNARLSLKQYLPIKNAQEQREILLLATKGDAKGIGLVALRDNDRYPQFRETLKNLLCLSTISQVQMRGQLLMMAGLAADGWALDVRELFGDDYDHILRRKEKLLRFKKQQSHIEMVVASGARRASFRNELAYRWRDMLPKRQAFEQEHIKRLETLRFGTETATQRIQELDAEIRNHRLQKEAFSERRGSLSKELDQIAKQATEFADFMEQWARTSLENMNRDVAFWSGN